MSEAELHASPTIRSFRTVITGGRLASSAVKDCLTSDRGRSAAGGGNGVDFQGFQVAEEGGDDAI
jgi:hypothetical protein